MKGKVIWFSSDKGFGFISQDDGSKDLFVHHSNIKMEGYRTLEPGKAVEYQIGQNDKGPQAVDVTPVNE